MLWILVIQCLIGAILAIGAGGNNYKNTHDFSSLALCCCGCGLLVFALMLSITLIFVA